MTVPTSPTNSARDRRGGFTLIELMMAMTIMAVIAALALPRVYPGGGATTERATAYAIAAVLRADRNAALSRGAATTTLVADDGRRIGSGSGAGGVAVPPDLDTSVRGVKGGAIQFLPDGRSSGGLITLAREKTTYTVRVDPITGGVMILTGAP